MVRIGGDEGNTGLGRSEAFGPLAVLLIGFMEDEVDKFKGLMVSMDADMVKVNLPPAVFAAAVPNNYQRQVEELVSEVVFENNAMMSRRSQSSSGEDQT
ncbi:MAG: hypothetical protein WDW38_009373 [Sanguina aurantia]